MGKCERLRTEECWREEGRNGEGMVRVTQNEWSKKEEGDIRQKRADSGETRAYYSQKV